jgi:hypothetical protein
VQLHQSVERFVVSKSIRRARGEDASLVAAQNLFQFGEGFFNRASLDHGNLLTLLLADHEPPSVYERRQGALTGPVGSVVSCTAIIYEVAARQATIKAAPRHCFGLPAVCLDQW